MTNTPINSQQSLQELYGVPFPEDFFHFWQFANEINSENPYLLPTNLTLVGAFEVLGGLIDIDNAVLPVRMHWRFHKDPPEFFTILCGDTDGLHFGYYYDDPSGLPSCMCSYFHNDAYQFYAAGATVFETVQQHCEDYINAIARWVEDGEYTPEQGQEEIDICQRFFEQMQDYIDRHSVPSPLPRQMTADTWDGMGIAVPAHTYRPLAQTRKADKLIEAQTALNEGFPGTALRVAKDLWSLHDPEWEPHAIALMLSAYPALNRPLLAEVLQEHVAVRDPVLTFIDLRMEIWQQKPDVNATTSDRRSLTPAQTDQIASTFEYWKALALSTQPINPDEAIAALQATYTALELVPPQIQVLLSPLAAMSLLAEIPEGQSLTPIASHWQRRSLDADQELESRIDRELLDQLNVQLSSELWKRTKELQSALVSRFTKADLKQ